MQIAERGSEPPAAHEIPLSDADNRGRFDIPETLPPAIPASGSGELPSIALPPLPEIENEARCTVSRSSEGLFHVDRQSTSAATTEQHDELFWQEAISILNADSEDPNALRSVSNEVLLESLDQAFSAAANPTRTDLQGEPETKGKRRKYKCGICRQPGHRQNACPLRRAQNPKAPSSHRCTVCKETGHNAATCLKKTPGQQPKYRQEKESRQKQKRALEEEEGGQPASFCSLAVHQNCY